VTSEVRRQSTDRSTESSGDLATGHGPARNTLFSLASQMISALFTMGLTLFLVRKLGPTDYGVLALAASVGLILLLVSDFGLSTAAARFAADTPTDRVHVAAVLRTALGLKLIASAVMVVGLVLFAPLIADAYGTDDLILPLRLMALAVAAQGIGGLFLAWFTALGRVSHNLRYQLVESTFETSASVGLVLLGGGAAGAVAGKAIGFTVAGIFAVALAIRVVGRPALRAASERGFSVRQIAGYGAVLVLINTAIVVFSRIDVLIIGAILGPADAGNFDAADRITTFMQYFGIAVAAGFAPRLAPGRRTAADTTLFMRAFRYTLLFYLLLAAATLVWAKPIVGVLLGSAYSSAPTVVAALAPSVILFGIGEVLAVAVNFLGVARSRVPLAIGALLINVVLDVILVPVMGVTAGALGTGVALVVYVAGHVRICQREMDVSFSSLIPTVLRGLVAAGVAALVLFAFGTEHLSPLDALGGAVLATLGYLSVLVLLRELEPGELRTAYGLIRSQLRRGSGDDAPREGT
jgi:O-antigen/teichoic acid export membrane protein